MHRCCACAQDYSEPATYGDYTISAAGQSHQIDVVAGGETDASGLGGACAGQIATAPDVQLDLQSGGAPLTFRVDSDIDTTLVVNTATGQWICDDDSGDDLNALIAIADPTTGIYDIWVGAFSDDENYSSTTLTISQGAVPSAPAVASVPTGVDRLERGTLQAGDATRGDGQYQDVYTFDGRAGESVVFDLRSDEFDTYLQVTSPSGQVSYNDDYLGDLSRSLLALDLDETGQYSIAVTSFDTEETGAYTLSISRPMVLANVPRIEETGTLSATDPTRPTSGGYVDTYEFEGAPGRRAIIDLTSDDFDTYLVLTSPSGTVRENDDLDSLYHSQIIADLQDTGTYRVQVTSYEQGETGDYRLTISQVAAPSGAPGQGAPDTAEMAFGQTIDGLLENSDTQYEPDRYQDLYSFNGQAGQHVRVEMSGGFDTYLIVRSPGGEEYTNDDFEGSITRSVVDVTLPDTGRYQVFVTSYGTDTFGNYEISLNQLATAPTRPETNVVDEGSTVYGIFAGISDYSQLRQTQPGWPDLQYTAQDAIVARDALMANAGMRAENAYTFTDRQATRANIEQAFREIAQRIDSNDVFVFFYSGHGGQQRRPGGFNAADADGYDETLALSDQTITDDEVDALFDEINAAAEVIILDSCYSGGFAKDVVSSPGRMGLFSSDEDVPSLVAAKFQAGGYLSYFFSEAVDDGHADEDGDHTINAMELSQYIHERYNEEAMAKGPSRFDTPHFGYQHLVVDRGGVAYDAVLFNLNN